MKGVVKDYLLLLIKLQKGICDKGAIPQADCVIIDDDRWIAYNSDYYIEVPVDASGIHTAVKFAKFFQFFRSAPEEQTFNMKVKGNHVILTCGKMKHKLVIEEQIISLALTYSEHFDNLEWAEIGSNFNETLAQKKFTHVECNNVFHNINFMEEAVISTDSIKMYTTLATPFEDELLLPASSADLLAKWGHPFTDYAVDDAKLAFRDETGAIVSFSRKLEEYPAVAKAVLDADIDGAALDLGDDDITAFLMSSSCVAEKHRTGESIFTLIYDEGKLKIKSGTDIGSSHYSLDVHTQESLQIGLTESVLKDIIDMGGEYIYDGSMKVAVYTPSFKYLATVVQIED